MLIDEAQLIPDIGISLKRITDYIEGVRLIVSGSSALEPAQITGADKETVERYIDLLEKAFIIFRLNAVIGNFQPFELRTDKGALWENYIISERIKMLNYSQFYGNYYFWRTFRQQEIDFIEEQDGRFSAFEFKLSHKKGARFSRSFTEAYPLKEARTITPGNLEEFLLEE